MFAGKGGVGGLGMEKILGVETLYVSTCICMDGNGFFLSWTIPQYLLVGELERIGRGLNGHHDMGTFKTTNTPKVLLDWDCI